MGPVTVSCTPFCRRSAEDRPLGHSPGSRAKSRALCPYSGGYPLIGELGAVLYGIRSNERGSATHGAPED